MVSVVLLVNFLGKGICFSDLYSVEGLKRVDDAFLDYLESEGDILFDSLISKRNLENICLDDRELIDLSVYLENFLAEIFPISSQIEAVTEENKRLILIYECNRKFIRRYAKKYVDEFKNNDISEEVRGNIDSIKSFCEQQASSGQNIDEFFISNIIVNDLLIDESENQEDLNKWACYCADIYINIGDDYNGVLYHIPQKIDFGNLSHAKNSKDEDLDYLCTARARKARDGFNLTDDLAFKDGISAYHANYCIFCHERDKDSCSKGLKGKDGQFKISKTREVLEGCPLEEKISEANLLKSMGKDIAALAVICMDNPLCAGTGYRICNDCTKSCIYQNQDPVNIPLIETNILNNVLEFDYGFEIYSLLTRWNPLKTTDYLPKEYSGKKVLVVGLGPAGYTLSHYLLNEGHCVIAVDGLKIEPLTDELVGKNPSDGNIIFKPIKSVQSDLYEALSERVIWGFGGVAEYGITVRWNKNYLKIIRLLLERRENFALYGGVRFGSNITYEDAFNFLKFDHIAMATGAGKPKLPSIPNVLAKGVMTASDFLMSLQLSGAYRKDILGVLSVSLPILVIGGGLTAVDAATEALSYYVVQVEKFVSIYEELKQKLGEEYFSKIFSERERNLMLSYQKDYELINSERKKAISDNREPDVLSLFRNKVKIIYRKSFVQSPCYRKNPEEVDKALQEGIIFIENTLPEAINIDSGGHVESISIRNIITDEFSKIDAGTVIIAIGTSPNDMFLKECIGSSYKFSDFKAGNFFSDSFEQVQLGMKKDDSRYFLVSNCNKKGSISIFGDLHPYYKGSVVKAMASAKYGYRDITKAMFSIENNSDNIYAGEFMKRVNDSISATVYNIEHLTKNVIKIVIKSHLSAKNFYPGQFFKLQNYETICGKYGSGFSKVFEGLALTGSNVDKDLGLVELIILQMGSSSLLSGNLKKDERVVLMGPTGEPTYIPENKNILLIGGGLGNAVLFSIGQSMKERGNDVTYCAGYRGVDDVFERERIESVSDRVIWACEEEILPCRDGDYSYKGNVIDAMVEFFSKNGKIFAENIDHIVVIGSDKMMNAVILSCNNGTINIRGDVNIVASINSPMQCMMKEICGKCIQRHVDPLTGEEDFVYSCTNQDQNARKVDFKFLSNRLSQGRLQEKICYVLARGCR